MTNPGNPLAIIALTLWIPLVFFFFVRYRGRPALAGALSVLGGVLFLPEKVCFNLPVLPDLDKVAIPVLTTLVACFIFARNKIAETKPFEGIDAIFFLILVADIGMWLTNTDALVSARSNTIRDALGPYEALGQIVLDVMMVYGTYYVGRVLFSRLQDVLWFVRVMFGFGLVYAGLALIELRFSPQLHTWVYGFMQSDFVHAARAGGYRPMIFLQQGLVFARFMAVALISGILLWRMNMLGKKGLAGLIIASLIFMVCKSLGALIFYLLFGPIVAFASSKVQRRVIFVFAFIVATYPLARGLDMLPIDDLLELFASYSQERADSMQTRFDNEASLLDRARERIWFGWGGFGRSLIYNENGIPTSIVDGEWIGIMGYRGIIGFIGSYGLYLLPLFLAVRRIKILQSTEHQLVLGGFTIITTILALDTIPNAASNLPHYFWSGAVAGAAQGFVREDLRLRRARQRERKEQLAAPADPAAA